LAADVHTDGTNEIRCPVDPIERPYGSPNTALGKGHHARRLPLASKETVPHLENKSGKGNRKIHFAAPAAPHFEKQLVVFVKPFPPIHDLKTAIE
jgi:hypothetical protein